MILLRATPTAHFSCLHLAICYGYGWRSDCDPGWQPEDSESHLSACRRRLCPQNRPLCRPGRCSRPLDVVTWTFRGCRFPDDPRRCWFLTVDLHHAGHGHDCGRGCDCGIDCVNGSCCDSCCVIDSSRCGDGFGDASGFDSCAWSDCDLWKTCDGDRTCSWNVIDCSATNNKHLLTHWWQHHHYILNIPTGSYGYMTTFWIHQFAVIFTQNVKETQNPIVTLNAITVNYKSGAQDDQSANWLIGFSMNNLLYKTKD